MRSADDPAAADLVDHPLALLEDAGALPGPPLPGGHLRRAGERPVGPARPGAGGVHRRASSPPTRSPCWTPPAPSKPCSSACRAAPWACCWPPTTRSGWRHGVHRARRRRSPQHAERTSTASTTRSTRRGVGQVQPPSLAARLPRLPGVLLHAVFTRAAFDQADRGRRRVGSGRSIRRRSPAPIGRTTRCIGRSGSRDLRRVSCPVLVIHGDHDRLRPHAPRRGSGRSDLRDTRDHRGRRPLPDVPRPGPGNLLIKQFVDRLRR